jgi:uncharacterized protein (DUF488 family)
VPSSQPVPNVFTVGHSTRSLDEFVSLLKSFSINAVVDVRSSPFSGRFPHFNRRLLDASLKERGLQYRFFGKSLGGRPTEPNLFIEGTADYIAMAQTPAFKEGIEKVLKGAEKHRLALMCSEGDPIECHRCLLVGRALHQQRTQVLHILPDASVQSQVDIEGRLLRINRQLNHDFFMPEEKQLEVAYRDQALKVAYTERSIVSASGWEAADVQYH